MACGGPGFIFLAVQFFLLPSALFAFCDELLISGDLFGAENRFHPVDLFFLHLEHGRPVLITNFLELRLGFIKDGLELVNLSRIKPQAAAHFRDIVVAKVF